MSASTRPGRFRDRFAVPLTVAAAVATLLAGACGQPGQPSASPTPSKAAAPALSPLTGLPLTSAAPERPVLVVKVDNTRNARPQVGVGSADLVVEELVEGGLTRLGAFFYLDLPAVVGPVRSLRTSDIPVVAPTQGVLVASGGAAKAKRKVAGAGVRTALPDLPGFYRESERRAPYNLMLRLEVLVREFAEQQPPPPYFDWAQPGAATPAGEPAVEARIRFSRAHTTIWRFRQDAGWTRENELASAPDAFAATNVLVLRVRTQDAGYRDPAGNPVPETVLTGSGDATLLHAGQALQCRWVKGAAAEPIRLADAQNQPLSMPPGRTWVELVPEGGSVSWTG